MMRTQDYEIPDELYYSKEHEWARLEGEYTVVGITDYAQKALHEIVYVETPVVGSELKQMEVMGVVESVKAVSDIFAPISGGVVEVNQDLAESPELVNKDPYGAGWIAKILPANLKNDLKNLMSSQQYADHLRKLEEK